MGSLAGAVPIPILPLAPLAMMFYHVELGCGKQHLYCQIDELICTKEQKIPPSSVVNKSGKYAKK